MSIADVADIPARETVTNRVAVVDVARGVALVAMTIYHLAWDLSFFGHVDPDVLRQPAWIVFARTIASSFLFLVGVGLVLGHGREFGRAFRPRPFLVRLAQIVAGAAAISVATYFFVPGGFIFFGILHAIALFSVLVLPFLAWPWWAAAGAGVVVLVVGNTVALEAFDAAPLVWLGLAANPPISNDFVPVFPFLAPVLFGVAAAKVMTREAWRQLARLPLAGTSWLTFIGRHSLLYYLAHQPILFGLLGAAAWAGVQPDPAVRAEVFRKAWVSECVQRADRSFCEPYAACMIGAVRREGLLDAVAANALDARQRQRLDGLIDGCVVEAGAASGR